MNETYAPATYAAVSSASVGGDRTAAIYSDRLRPLETQSIAAITHPTFAIRFGFTGDARQFPGFTAVPVHLKSGDGSAERVMRESEAQTIRQTIETLAPRESVIMAGDFNTLGARAGLACFPCGG